MRYIEWDEESELGIPLIDEQHRGIVSLINTLHFFLSQGRVEEVLEPTLIMLLQYTKVHFKTEETLLEEVGYPKLKAHKKLHEKLIEDTEDIVNNVEKTKDAKAMIKFLRDWWMSHINIEDRLYTPYFF